MNASASKLDAHAIELVEALTREAAKPEIVSLPTSGLGQGLPSTVPVGFDRVQQKLVSVRPLIEEHRLAPQRRKGTATADTLKSFIDLINRHKDEQSALFGKTTWPEPKLTAVINYDSTDADARYGDHRVVYTFPLTEEFKVWINNNKKPMDQRDFAGFLEDHAAELASPMDGEKTLYERDFREKLANPSELLELSRSLEVHVTSKVKQCVRLQTGERVLEFSEEHQNNKGEPVVIPGIFIVSVRAFVDGDPVRIPARLRYRTGGEIKWHYELYRWENFLREQVEHDLFEAAKAPELPSFQGAPEAGQR